LNTNQNDSKGYFKKSNGFNYFDNTYGSKTNIEADTKNWNFDDPESKITTTKSIHMSNSQLKNDLASSSEPN